ncbi:hypothetical protein N8940_00465, partial [Sphingomonadaceae bacterium]|nr:hypothetical protein [Sphingomonadaceae bacterium]
MALRRIKAGKGVSASALLLAASLLMAVPGTGLALGGIGDDDSLVPEELTPFTPADVDPQLALRVARD